MSKKRYRFTSYSKREEFVELLLKRDGDICSVCGRKLDINAAAKLQNNKDNPLYISLDHIIPFCKGGPNTRENLRLLHKKCNSYLGMITDPCRKKAIKRFEQRYLQKDHIIDFGE